MIAIQCSKCGSENVTRDASAAWDVDAQDWTLSGVMDQATCEDCGGETNLVEVPTGWIIRGVGVHDSTGNETMYWSNDDGWVPREYATIHSDDERDDIGEPEVEFGGEWERVGNAKD